MKKITLLSVLFLFTICFNSYAQISEDFETDPPTGWTFMQTEGDDPGFVQTSARANSGTYSFYHNDDNITVSSTSWMISPSLTVSTGDILSFYHNHNFDTYGEENGIWISTVSADPIANPGDFTLLYDLLANLSEDTWTEYNQSLDAYNGMTVYFAFKYAGDWEDELYIDDFFAGTPPTETADWNNLQWPPNGAITTGDNYDVYSRVYEPGITDAVGQGAGIEAWIGYDTADTDPSAGGWTWIASTFNVDDGANNDEYMSEIGSGLSSGTYYYASRFRVEGGPYTYGGTGGFWNNDSGDLTVTDPPPPANDTMAGATPIVPSAAGTGCATFTFADSAAGDGTTDSGLDGSCNTTDTGLDRFYSWTATTDALIWNDGDGGPGIVIRNAAGVEITCSATFAAADTVLSGWTIGDDLIIQVYDYGTADVDTSFCLEQYTIPGPIVPDYSNDFSSFPGAEWSEAAGVYGTPTGTTSSWASDDFGNDVAHANGNCAKLNIYGTTSDEYLVSPTFDLSGVTYYLNFGIALTEWGNTNSATLGADDYVALLVTQDGTTWSELTRWDSSSTLLAGGAPVTEITLSGYNATTQFAFFGFSDTTNEDNDFFVDNFDISSISSLSVEDNIIEGFKMYPNPVNDVLSFRALDNIETISFYNLLGQEVMRMQPQQLQTQVDMSNLPTGMYVVKVQVGEQLGSYRVVKQ